MTRILELHLETHDKAISLGRSASLRAGELRRYIYLGEIMKLLFWSVLAITLTGCVAGAPKLTEDQTKRIDQIEVFLIDNKTAKEYEILGEVSAADCSGPGGSRLYGDASKSIDILIKKAIALNADAVVDVDCSGVPYINNCWLAEKCDGYAVKWK